MSEESFSENPTNSSMFEEAYELIGAKTPQELSLKYDEQDQILMKSQEWDYDNPELITNKIKKILENLDDSKISKEEVESKKRILWFWYHHAISCAIQKKDKQKAQHFTEKALEIQDNQNQITKILYFLVNDRLDEAKEFAKTIPHEILDDGNENPEPETARDLISKMV